MVKKKTASIKSYFKLPSLSPKSLIFISIFLFLFVSFLGYNLLYWDKIFPGIYIAGTSVGGQTPDHAEILIRDNRANLEEIRLTFNGQVYKITPQDLQVTYDYRESVEAAYNFDRWGNLFFNLYQRAIAPVRNVNLALFVNLNEEALDKTLGVIAEEISVDPVYPSVTLNNNEILVETGSPGNILDKELLVSTIKYNLTYRVDETIGLPLKNVDPSINQEAANLFAARAEKLIGKKLILNSPQESFEWNETKIFKALDPLGNYKKEVVHEEVLKLAGGLNSEPQNPVFIFEEGRVQEFTPAKDGTKVEEDKLTDAILTTLASLEEAESVETALEIPFTITSPKIKTGDVNNLGGRELIGKGTSTFRGSIANRVHNIGHASSKFKGVLIPPGQTFSFNDVLGDVSSLTGYKQAFVIKDGKTVLGDGGGVCQVSSTFFRAALNAGLPIVERKAHSYRVSYYEQGSSPGLDATVYAPTTDLKVLNDTPGHILIQPIFDAKNWTLSFELYGSSDGRVAKITKPVVSGVTAPPEDLYIDDPTLPVGQTKQIDFKAWGAKVVFDYSVERGGETIYQKTFVSNFRPWQAVYLRGTSPI